MLENCSYGIRIYELSMEGGSLELCQGCLTLHFLKSVTRSLLHLCSRWVNGVGQASCGGSAEDVPSALYPRNLRISSMFGFRGRRHVSSSGSAGYAHLEYTRVAKHSTSFFRQIGVHTLYKNL